MAGRHADNGDRRHVLTSGEFPEVGMRVIGIDMKWGTITKVRTDGECGWHCPAWHTVTLDDGGVADYNCERMATFFDGMPDPKRPLNIGDEGKHAMPYSEVCMHLRVAGKVLRWRVVGEVGSEMVQLLTSGGTCLSFPITPGEAGLHYDSDRRLYAA